MKKKSVMSKEALAAMFGADTTDTTDTTDANLQATDTEIVVEPTAEELAAAEAKTEEDRIAAEAADDNTEPEPNEELVALQAEFDAFRVTTEAAEVTHTEALAAVEQGAVNLKDIVIDQISKMRLVLGGAPADMSAWDVAAVVTEYNTSKDAFVKSLPTGSVIPKDEAEDTKETKARVIDNSVDSAAYKSLGFK